MNKKPNPGFTLVEMMIGIVIIMIIFGGIFATVHILMRQRVFATNNWKAEQKLRNVAEEIRNEAADFENMDTVPNRPRPAADPDAYYPEIKVFATISLIDPVTRTRSVQLVAKWRQGGSPDWIENGPEANVKVATQTFSVAHIKGKAKGASVKVKVWTIGSHIPIAKVRITAVGQDASEVFCDTNAEGTCTMDNVLLGAGIFITANGEIARHYFEDTTDLNNYPSNSFSWKQDFQVTTVAGITNDSKFTTPIEMYPPGKIRGLIKDIVSNAPQSDCKIALYKVPGRLKKDVALGGSDAIQLSSAPDGSYEFSAVIPGYYSIYFIGSSTYAALARRPNFPGDGDYVTRQEFLVASETVVDKSYRAVQRGSVGGRIKRARFQAGQYRQGANVNGKVPFRITRNVHQSYFGTSAPFNFLWSLAYVLFYGPGGATHLSTVRDIVTDSNGQFLARYLAPRIIEQDNASFPYTQQFDKVSFSPGQEYVAVPAPLAPIMVVSNSLPADRFNVHFVIADWQKLPRSAPQPSINVFRKIYTNDQALNPDETIFYLDRSEMVPVSGIVQRWDPNTLMAAPLDSSGFFRTQVSTLYSDNGFGGMWTNNDMTAYMVKNYYQNTTSNAGQTTFNFVNQMGDNILPPNIGNDATVIHYFGQSQTMMNKQFEGPVIAHEKTGPGTFLPIPSGSLNVTNPPLRVKAYDSGVAVWTADIKITNGQWELVNQQQIRQSQSYSGDSAPVQLQPGNAVNNMIINVPMAPSTTYQQYQIEIQDDAPNYRWFNNYIGIFAQPYFTYNTLSGKYNSIKPLWLTAVGTGRIYGHVFDPDGKPVTGAKVTLKASGMPDQIFMTVNDVGCNACIEKNGYTGSYPGYQYVFDPARFAMLQGINYWLTVEAQNFNTGLDQKEAYKNIEWQADFNLIKPVTPPPPPQTGNTF